MNALRLLVAGALVCALTIGVRAEDKKDNAKLIVGNWEITKTYEKGPAVGSTVEFTKDGKMKVSHKVEGKDVTAEGTYKVDGDTFTFMLKTGENVVNQMVTIKKLTDTELSTTNKEGKDVDLKRKK
jgi:uncharacterized protein (TIGR03066 family)